MTLKTIAPEAAIANKSGLTDQTELASIQPLLPPCLRAAKGGTSTWIASEHHGSGTPLTDAYMSERVITDPVAAVNGTVFFTTFRPTTDVCGYGGDSYIWAVDYDSGSTPMDASMKGKILLQVSTGSFEEKDLSVHLPQSVRKADWYTNQRGSSESARPVTYFSTETSEKDTSDSGKII